jgi:hypothetical protein
VAAGQARDVALNPEKLWKQLAPFNAVFYRSLMALDRYAPDPRHRQTSEAYLERVWNEARDPQTGFFHLGGVGLSVLAQAAFV